MAQMPSDQPAGHKSATHAIIIMMLVALMAVETATLGFVVTKVGMPSGASSVTVPAATVPPEFYTRPSKHPLLHDELVMIDRATGKETVLFDGADTRFVKIVAVPQKNYTGKIYVNVIPEGSDVNALRLNSFDVNSKKLTPVDLGFLPDGDAFAVSPDQTKIAILDDSRAARTELRSVAVFWDLLSGKAIKQIALPVDEYFSSHETEIGSLTGYQMAWDNERCVLATIYSVESRNDAGIREGITDGREICAE